MAELLKHLTYEWSFNKGMYDLVAGTKMSIPSNVVDFRSDRFDIPKGAIDFDGTTESYASVPPGAYFGKEFTISFWVLVKEKRSWQRVIDFGDGQNKNSLIGFFDLKPSLHALSSNGGYCLGLNVNKQIELNK